MDIHILEKQLEREKRARLEAEHILELKSRELYVANSELKTLTADLMKKEARTSAILEAAADGIIVVNFFGEIESFNKAASDLFVYEDLTQFNIQDLIQLDNKEGQPTNVLNLLSEPSKLFEVNGIKSNNVASPMELSIAQIRTEDASLIVCALRDISARKNSEKRSETQYEITRVLAEGADIQASIQKILEIICNSFNFSIGEFWVANTDKNDLKVINVHNRLGQIADEFVAVTKKTVFQNGIGMPGRIYAKKEPIFVPDVAVDDNFPRRPAAIKAGLHSCYGAPIIYGTQVNSIIIFYTDNIVDFDAECLRLLSNIGTQIGLFIERKLSEKRIRELNNELVKTARLAGMSEVAICVIHNVGNVLNSINVSIDLLMEKLNKSKINKLNNIVEYLEQFTQLPTAEKDKKIKLLQNYLAELKNVLGDELKECVSEATSLFNNVQHVKEIILLQQKSSDISGVVEPINLRTILDDSISIGIGESHDVIINKDYPKELVITVDKVRLQQILVNLVRNAKESIVELNPDKYEISVIAKKVQVNNLDWVEITIKDNGLGVEKENLNRLFSFGFTTKKQGHGFGLHISALSVTEMGGTLKVESEGIGKGAAFILRLPLKPLDSANWISMDEIKSSV